MRIGKRKILAYATAWTFGHIFGPFFWFLVLIGRIKIKGRDILVKSAAEGNLIIAANHPSMLDPFLITAIQYPGALWNERRFPWSMPDYNYLPWILRMLYPLFRCVTIDRKVQNKKTAGARHAAELLKRGAVIVMHPEGGRTSRGRHHKDLGARRIRRVVSGATWAAKMSGARILPMWIDMPGAYKPRSLFQTLGLVLHSPVPVLISIRHQPYEVYGDPEEENRKLEWMILSS